MLAEYVCGISGETWMISIISFSVESLSVTACIAENDNFLSCLLCTDLVIIYHDLTTYITSRPKSVHAYPYLLVFPSTWS